MTLTCAIIDDEPLAISLLEIYVDKTPFLRLTAKFNSALEALPVLSAQPVELLFLDIQMPELSGMELSRMLPTRTRVVFTTAFDRYAVEGFRVGAVDYLLKPIDPAALKRAVERCRQRDAGFDAERLLAAIRAPRAYKQRYIVRFNDRIVPVKSEEIAYFYSEEKNTYLVTNDGSRYVMDLSLDILSEELDAKRFFRISRNCIISMPAIVSVVKYQGNRLKIVARPRPAFDPVVSRSRVDDFLRWLEGEA